jgi:hypothetical protein
MDETAAELVNAVAVANAEASRARDAMSEALYAYWDAQRVFEQAERRRREATERLLAWSQPTLEPDMGHVA